MTKDPVRLQLGLGEEARIRCATRREQAALGLHVGDLVVEYRHTDRQADVLPARGVLICPRGYGVRLPDGGPQEQM